MTVLEILFLCALSLALSIALFTLGVQQVKYLKYFLEYLLINAVSYGTAIACIVGVTVCFLAFTARCIKHNIEVEKNDCRSSLPAFESEVLENIFYGLFGHNTVRLLAVGCCIAMMPFALSYAIALCKNDIQTTAPVIILIAATSIIALIALWITARESSVLKVNSDEYHNPSTLLVDADDYSAYDCVAIRMKEELYGDHSPLLCTTLTAPFASAYEAWQECRYNGCLV